MSDDATPRRACRGRAFAAPEALRPGATVTLDGAESHYLVRVRRVGAGDRVEVLDGLRTKFAAAVVRADPHACVVSLEETMPAAPAVPCLLLVGIVEARAMADVVTGASEVGASRLLAVRTQRTQAKLPAAERLDKIIRAAQRQCGRAVPLRVEGPVSLADALRVEAQLPGFVAVPATDDARATAPEGARVLIGPEGGLTAAEVEQALDAGFVALGLGPYVQRTPTAVVSAVARLRRS